MAKARVIITCGLGYGDEGKGSIVDSLVRKYGACAVLRYNGGPQSAHYVTTPDGIEHCFSQFGSGTLIPGVLTHLAKPMLIKPQNLIAEERELRKKGITDALSRLSIDPECTIVTPYHAMIGQMLELSRGKDRHGSVGMGVGQAALDREKRGSKVIRIRDASHMRSLKVKLLEHRVEKVRQGEEILRQGFSIEMERIFDHFQAGSIMDEVIDTCQILFHKLPIQFTSDDIWISQCIRQKKTLVCEGAQGALIDYHYGFWPHVTKTDTTMRNAENLLNPHAQAADIERIGILRAYNYRHGPGPFVSEDDSLRRTLPETHNKYTDWQGDTRAGWLDLPAIRYAIAINPHVERLILTHIDRLSLLDTFRVCISYEYCGTRKDLLNRYFKWKSFEGGRIRITSMKPVLDDRSGQFSEMLLECRPLEFRDFPGAPEDISQVREFDRLPERIRSYISFLESREGLNLPIGVVSTGPAYAGKIFRE